MAAASGEGPPDDGVDDGKEVVREQDRLLPIANIGRLMKRALPASAKIAKESKDSVQEAVTEFIQFITCDASDRLSKDQRKTLSGEDIMESMSVLGYHEYAKYLEIYLALYKDAATHKKRKVEAKVKTQPPPPPLPPG